MHNCSLAQGHPVSRCVTPEKVTAATASPCCRFLALGGESGALYFFSVLTGEMLWLRKGHVRGVSCVAFSSDSSLVCSASLDTTCRTMRIGGGGAASSSSSSAGFDQQFAGGGGGGKSGGGVVVMTGHTLAVTACAFTTFAHRVVSVSKDRTCRISDPLTGAVLRVYTAAHPLCSVCVGPADSVIACGAANGALVFFSAPTTAATTVASSASSSLFTSGPSDSFSNNEECRVVGPFSGGGPQAPIFFVSNIFGAFESASSSSASGDGGASAAGAAAASTPTSSTAVGIDALVAVSRDGFCQVFSWSTGAFVRDVVRLRRGAMAACLIPGPLSRSPQWTRFAMTTISDRALIQRSAIPLKKAPVQAAGTRAFQLRSFPSATAATTTDTSFDGRRRDRVDESGAAAVAKHSDGLLERVEVQALKARHRELLLEANRLFAEQQQQQQEE